MVPMWGLQMGGAGPARLADLRSILMDIVFAADAFARVAELDGDDPGDGRGDDPDTDPAILGHCGTPGSSPTGAASRPARRC